jgi:ABC-type sulfate transport system substrate-binding protein
MTDPKFPKVSPKPAIRTEPPVKRVRKPLSKSSADDHASDAHGDFFYDELMTAQPDATQDYYRRQLMKHVAAKPPGEEPK